MYTVTINIIWGRNFFRG